MSWRGTCRRECPESLERAGAENRHTQGQSCGYREAKPLPEWERSKEKVRQIDSPASFCLLAFVHSVRPHCLNKTKASQSISNLGEYCIRASLLALGGPKRRKGSPRN